MQEQYRVIVPDLRGFGQSEPPVGDYYMEGQARAIKELLDALGVEECALVTHDFGGPVGLTIDVAVSRPHRSGVGALGSNVFTDTYVPPTLPPHRSPVSRRFSPENSPERMYATVPSNPVAINATWTVPAIVFDPSGLSAYSAMVRKMPPVR